MATSKHRILGVEHDIHGETTDGVFVAKDGQHAGRAYFVQPSRRGGDYGEWGYITIDRKRWSVNLPGGIPEYAVATRPDAKAINGTVYKARGSDRRRHPSSRAARREIHVKAHTRRAPK